MKLFLQAAIFFFIGTLISCPNSANQKIQSIPSEITPQPGEQSAKGFVFNDRNHNGLKDSGENGIAGVAVSNGKLVVMTDAKGAYSIPVAQEGMVFLIKPRNYQTPVNKDMLPQFYYIHKPQGSPADFRFKGIEPTGNLPTEINFPLVAHNESDNFSILVFGDTQPYSLTDVDYLAEDIVKDVKGKSDAVFGITMGDIVGDDLSLFEPVNQAIAKIEIPWFYVKGNHDRNYDAQTDEDSDDTYESVYGPATYAFQYGNVHFIIFDDVIHEYKKGYTGGLRNDQLEFLENYLKIVPKEHLVVMNMHIPFTKTDDSFRAEDQTKLFGLLKDFPHTYSMSAHTHIQEHLYFSKENSAWLQNTPHHHYNVGTTCGSWWSGSVNEQNIPETMMYDGTPNGYAHIHFKGNAYTIDYKVAGREADYQMNIYIPREVAQGTSASEKVYVNYFNGSDLTKVFCLTDSDTTWLPMTQTRETDPYFNLISQRGDGFEKLGIEKLWTADTTLPYGQTPCIPVPDPIACPHLWSAPLKAGLSLGRHSVEIKVQEPDGRVFKDIQFFRVVE